MILEKFVGDEEITAKDLRVALRDATIANEVVPVLNGTAFKNKGVQPLLDAVVDYLPSPLDLRPHGHGTPEPRRAPRSSATARQGAVLALAFKIMTDPYVGKLTYFRVYSGQLDKGGQVLNARTGNKERIGRLLEMHANARGHRLRVDGRRHRRRASASRTPSTGDTLCDERTPIVLERSCSPSP